MGELILIGSTKVNRTRTSLRVTKTIPKDVWEAHNLRPHESIEVYIKRV